MLTGPAIGFIGFGEAGFHIARGLRGAGIFRLSAYDINTYTPGLGERIRQRAEASRTSLVDSSGALVSASDILFSTVTAGAAREAADQTAPFLARGPLYADLNSVSPALKQSIDRVITGAGGRFIEGAVMAAVPPHGHRVPILLGGAHAPALANVLAPYGMRLEVFSAEVGAASAVKLCRSIVIKGMEALLVECALASARYSATDRVFASLDETFPGMNWSELAQQMIDRVAEHGERRAQEMEEAAKMLGVAGIEPIMVEATARRQRASKEG